MSPLRAISLTVLFFNFLAGSAFSQPPALVFTFGVPDSATASTEMRVTSEVDERALALWSGNATDFGEGVSVRRARWTVRSMTSLTTLPFGGRARPGFQQVDVVRPLLEGASLSISAGGGIRQTRDGAPVFLARILGTFPLGAGRLQGSVVVERATASPSKRDAADVVTSVGWTRPINAHVSIGMEGIGQDLEGLWDRAEVDGGAKLLAGPSVQLRSKSGEWAASITAGPVYSPRSTAPDIPRAGIGGRHFGVFASTTWVPFRR